MSYSIAGSQKIVEGPITAQIISPTGGAVQLMAFNSNTHGNLGAPLLEMSRIESSSIFAETWERLLEASIQDTESLGAKLDDATITEIFDEDLKLCQMLQQVAKIISLSQVCNTSAFHGRHPVPILVQLSLLVPLLLQGAGSPLDTERDVFVVNLGGFDTHSDLLEDFSANMQVRIYVYAVVLVYWRGG